MFRAPRQLPPLQAMLADIGHPAPAVIGRALGVHERTVYHWIARDQAPRPASLALFWETRWGRSQLQADAVNAAMWAAGEAAALRQQVQQLQQQIARLESLGQFASANAPILAAPILAAPILAAPPVLPAPALQGNGINPPVRLVR